MTKKTQKKPIISHCGICCSLCPPYKDKECPGCAKLPDCKIQQCAKNKSQQYCFECSQFPCTLYEKGFDWDLNTFPFLKKYNPGIVKWKPFSTTYIKYFKLAKKSKENKNNK
jgi:hypothetical protein